MTRREEVKETFYEELDCLIKSAPPNDKLLLLRDYNASISYDFNN